MILERFWQRDGAHYLPPDFTPQWLLFYGKMIRTQMVISNFMPYVGVGLKILFKRGCCCCKRKDYKIKKSKNPEFQLEKRYGQMLTTFFTCFTYGFMMPDIFAVAGTVFFLQYVLDKLLISYYFKERLIHNNLLNRSVLRLLKYGLVLFLWFGGGALRENYCAIANADQSINYTTELLPCAQVVQSVWFLYGCALVVLGFFLFGECGLSIYS